MSYNDGSTGTHTTIVDSKNGNYCSCWGFVHGNCKHVKEAMKNMPIKFDRDIKTHKSSIEAMNELFGGIPYKSDQPFLLYGAPSSGKSLALSQEACFFSSKGLNVLYIDDEGSSGTYLKQWGKVFEKRFGELKGDIIVHQTSDMYDLIRYLGATCKVDFVQSTTAKKKKAKETAKDQGAEVEEMEDSVNGKQEFRKTGDIKDPEFIQEITKSKINAVFLDSITYPLIPMFQTGVQNYPARNDATALILGLLSSAQTKYNLFVMATSHASTNPTNPYEIHEQLKGGRAVRYFGKNVVYIDRREAKDAANYRRLWGARIENKQDWSQATVCMITDDGYVDVDDKKVSYNTAFTSAELKRLGLDAYMEEE